MGFRYIEEQLRQESFLHIIKTDGTLVSRMEWELKGDETLVFTPDGQQVITGSSRGDLRVWDIASASELLVHHFNDTDIYGVDVSPDGQTLVIAGLNQAAYWWDWLSGEPPVPMQGIRRGQLCQYTPDGSRVITGSDSLGLIVWDSKTRQPVSQLPGVAVYNPVFSTTGDLITVSEDTIEFWDIATARRVRTIPVGPQSALRWCH